MNRTHRFRFWCMLALTAACGQGVGTAARDSASTVSDQDALMMEVAQDAPERAGTATAGRASPAPRTPGAISQTAVLPTMIIRTGTAIVQVDSLEPAVARVRRLAQQLGGFVANTSMRVGREEARQATLELKIPAARFDQAVNGLAPLGKVESVNVVAEDVGEEFVDVSARTANSRRLEERLVNLLATRTGRLEDVLAVERELARVREEIERYEGRLRYLRTRAAVSTLTVELHEPRPIVGEYPGSSVLGNAFRQSWRNFVGFLAAFIAALGILIPVGLLALAAWYVFSWLRRRRNTSPDSTPD